MFITVNWNATAETRELHDNILRFYLKGFLKIHSRSLMRYSKLNTDNKRNCNSA